MPALSKPSIGLLQSGANPNRQDAYLGHYALHRAVQAQSQPIAQ